MYETDFKGCAHSALFSISWKFKGPHVIIMSRTRFGVNLHSIVCLNVKEPLARSRRHIWSLSDCNGIWTHNHLVRKRTLNHLVKLVSLAQWLTIRFRDIWLWTRIPLESLSFQISRLFWARSFSRIMQLQSVDSL